MNDPRRARLTDEAEDIEATPALLAAADAPELPVRQWQAVQRREVVTVASREQPFAR